MDGIVKRQLDFGCGDASCSELTPDRKRYHNWLIENGGFGTYGIDVDPEKIAVAQKRVPPSTKVILADGHETPFPDHFFDHVHVAGVLHHMCNYHQALKEIDRITKPGASLYILETCDNDPIFRIARRVVGSFRNDEIECCFRAERLEREVKKYFKIKSVSYYWRFYLSDLALNFRKEPQFSLTFNNWVNGILSNRGWNKYWCSHVVIEAEK